MEDAKVDSRQEGDHPKKDTEKKVESLMETELLNYIH